MTQIAIAIAGNIGPNQGMQGRQDPQMQQLQTLMQFMQGMMAGQMLAQIMRGGMGQQGGCPCSRNQNPNFGMNPMNGNMAFNPMMAGGMPFAGAGMPFGGGAPFQATPFPSLATGGFGPNMNASNSLLAGLPSLAMTGGAAMQAAQMQMLHSDQQQGMTIGTIGGGFPSGYMGLPGSFSNNLGMFLG